MDQNSLRILLEQVSRGGLPVEEALERLRMLPYELFREEARIDHHRSIRTGFPEIIYAEGKTDEQVVEIFNRLKKQNGQVLATRVSAERYERLKDRLAPAIYHPAARLLSLDQQPDRERHHGVLVISAGTSDIPVAEEAAITAELLGNGVERIYDVGVAGIHRLLEHLPKLQQARVLIVVAGMEGALPSVVGGLVAVPVVAVPTSVGYGASFQGLAALLGMLNSCVPGVAVVNIDNGFGAGCLASRINQGCLQKGRDDQPGS